MRLWNDCGRQDSAAMNRAVNEDGCQFSPSRKPE